MGIHLSDEIEQSIEAMVQAGDFIPVGEPMVGGGHEAPPAGAGADRELGSIGAMWDAADALDAAVEHAMLAREGRPWG
jgi:hypothetical protein